MECKKNHLRIKNMSLKDASRHCRVNCKMPSFSDIFTWNGWDDWGETKIFYTCVLLRDVGDYKKGAEFETILYNDEKLTLEFYEDDGDPMMVKKLGIVD